MREWEGREGEDEEKEVKTSKLREEGLGSEGRMGRGEETPEREELLLHQRD